MRAMPSMEAEDFGFDVGSEPEVVVIVKCGGIFVLDAVADSEGGEVNCGRA